MSGVDWPALKAAALAVQGRAYAPYSNYHVGAALLTADGEIIAGCNVENATFGATCCAERTAVFAAVAAGHLAFRAIAVVTNGAAPGTPCGICRQVLAEFGRDLEVLCFTPEGAEARYLLSELLPHAFTLK
ncbi:MAG: cytidine deaminase [Hyphomonas sp.]|uniref:cytidine deaminase n=1 Tax=Hyphomonas sp. TaxID=87 RepID=UPI00182E0C60|nr:cytidine deaminase [Hyphomonas sp.]MBU3921547.1 cytidine deaminase [Alphaproteobacteria bacterium]MBA3068919.1 cytidine deaminase [Hyphomonas sp.]MBU4061083.1 cytidine deaminase [Alphaproteobacteria bacterium]MBU4162807.1 cytidine deaminase [Alphaproteobacteria bacterium]MBU4567912.1 cytidine deaminase [Alphaproteobacteria bacterium]